MKANITFSDVIRESAGRRNLSLTELARISGIHLSNLSRLASGKRPCGLSLAVRLADALWLAGAERMTFLQAAAGTTSRKERVLGHGHSAYPPEVLSLAANYLNSAGITPDQIVRIETDVRDGLRLVLTNGDRPELHISLS